MKLRHLSLLALFVSPLAAADIAPGKPAEAAPAPAEAAPPAEVDPLAGIPKVEGPATGKLGTEATLQLPAGMTLLETREAIQKFYDLTKNTTSGNERGVVLPIGLGEEWWLDFSFDAMGYVKDADKEELDADAILKAKQEGQKEGNAARRARGWDDLEVVGWHTPPKYDPATQNLEWGLRLKSKNGESVNYEVRVLGRRGVMSATLIASPEQMNQYLPRLRTLLAGFAFVGGEDYASYQEGDKIAEYGLTALVAGGALAVAAKSGLLGKLWKFIVLGIAAIGGFIGKLFGKKKTPPTA